MFWINFLSLLCVFLLSRFAASSKNYTRDDFPSGFIFGSGMSAYQYEGAAFDYGRKPGIIDIFFHTGRGDGHGATGDVSCDGFHKFQDDIKLMSEMGLEAFRFSISWSRLIPDGRGPVNPLGLEYYNNFINELISHGIQPHVTLHHFDLPQALHDEYGGWLNKTIVKDFTAYAEVCFRHFGDRVKFWTTINEANAFSIGGYSDGITPPGRCSPSIMPGCVGNSSTEPYIVAHNILLAHSATWRLYRNKYKATQEGFVGYNILGIWFRPFSDSEEDIAASQRATDFITGWLLSPMVFGKYPESVRKRAQGRIPIISKDESEQMKGSFDFLGLNHYTALLIKDDNITHDIDKLNFDADASIMQTLPGMNGSRVPINGYPVMPSGFASLLEYLKDSYGNPPIYIHENGQRSLRNGTLNDTLNDTDRVIYLDAYIGAVLDAVRNGSNVKGYMTWSFLDCLELLDGYGAGYGLYYVDLDDDHKRYPKTSVEWYTDFLKGNSTKKISEVVGENGMEIMTS